MLSATSTRLIIIAAFFVCIFISGFWMSNAGRPLNVIVFNLHKFIALGAVVLLALIVIETNKAAPLTGTQIATIVLMVVLFVATIITGGLMSIEREMPVFVARLHLILPFLTVLSTIGSMLVLLRQALPA